jgi:uncharacterized protein (DUF2249 family)
MRLLVISYYSGFPARVTSEWLEDRLKVCREQGIHVTLITSPQSQLRSQGGLKVIKVPSISFQDFIYEWGEMKANVSSTPKPNLNQIFLFPLVFSIGFIFDALFKALAGARSSGMYSWSLSALIFGIAVATFSKFDGIYATGGPSAAQLAGTLVGKIGRIPVHLEFQDPFIGSEMHVTSVASKVLRFLEAFFAKNATQITMVTKKAGDDFLFRHPNANAVIRSELPGAWDFDLRKSKPVTPSDRHEFVITHLGTLYGGRSLDSFFEGLDLLPEPLRKKIRVQNIGGVFVERGDEYRKRECFSEIGYLPRFEALTLATQSDALILVQHRDSRSHETIPYKTYDYLNLGLPIIALVDNPELSTLITNCGGIASDVHSPERIASDLARLLHGEGSLKHARQYNPNIQETFSRLVGLVPTNPKQVDP